MRIIVTCFAVTLLLIGCGRDEGPASPPPESWGLPPINPHNVASNLTRAITEQDSLHYAAQLADSFRFYFAAYDTAGYYHAPAWWGRAEELIAMGRLFGGEVNRMGFGSAEVALFTWNMGTYGITADSMRADVVATDLNLGIKVWQRDTGDPLNYVALGDSEHLWFEKDGPTWKVVRWEEGHTGGIGFTKLLWREPPKSDHLAGDGP